MITRYLDCSQININTYKQRDIAGQYAQCNACPIDIFLTEHDIKNIKDNINSKENTIIIANDEVGISIVSLYNYLRLHPELKDLKGAVND